MYPLYSPAASDESTGQGQIVRSNGAENANYVLGKMTTDKAVLVHNSPYAEMAGQPEDGPQPPLEVDFNWRAEKT